jgi:hypothetical protein
MADRALFIVCLAALVVGGGWWLTKLDFPDDIECRRMSREHGVCRDCRCPCHGRA